MNPTTGSHSFGDLRQLLREAKAGDPGSVELMLAACREFLVAIAREELPDVPDRESELQPLVDGALRQVPAILAALAGTSESDPFAELRRAFREQIHTLSGRPATDLADRERGDASTRGPGSGDTPEHSDAAESPAPPTDAPAPTTDQPQRRESPPDASLAGVQTVPESSSAASAESAGRAPPVLTKLEGFERISEVAVGGMGVVYRAWQTRLKRWVALKCLPPEFADDPDRLKRFRQEALLPAGLTEPGIVQVYDVLEQNGTPILVLSFIDGCDLGKIISQRRQLRDGKDVPGPHAESLKSGRDFAARMLPFFDRILDALVGLHGAGVLHRDLKPANILVDKNGNGWLTDFGLARPDHSDAATHPRQVMGTRGYMSPEQWEGDEGIDARTDVFATGVTIYETLTLELPYGKSRITAATPPADLPQPGRRSLPPNLDLVLLKAIHPERRLRYQTAADLRDDWQRVRKGHLPRKADVGLKRRVLHIVLRRTSQVAAAVAIVLAAGFLAAFAARPPAPTPMPEPELMQLRRVLVTTKPSGARVALVPLDPNEGMPQFEEALQSAGKTPTTVPAVKPGDYLVVVEIPGHGFHEVFRHVPRAVELNPADQGKPSYAHTSFDNRGDTAEIPLISVPKLDVAKGMVLFPGGEFIMGREEFGPSLARPHQRELASFFLDKNEVTVAEYRSVRKSLPEYADRSLRGEKDPVRFVTFDQAVRCAEEMGKRLPDEAEYEFAATNAGSTDFPWGNDFGKITSWNYGPVGSAEYDRSLFDPDVRGLFSNVAEWTSSWHTPYPGVPRPPGSAPAGDLRVVRGGPWGVVKGTPLPGGREEREYHSASWRHGVDRDRAYPGLGFRCARSLRPRFPQPAGKQKT